jgi:ABC-type uncharacterized transport system YnjBCD ATPase subunit
MEQIQHGEELRLSLKKHELKLQAESRAWIGSLLVPALLLNPLLLLLLVPGTTMFQQLRSQLRTVILSKTPNLGVLLLHLLHQHLLSQKQ